MKWNDVSVPVLVLRMDHYGALGVMRSLGRWGVQTYGVHATANPFAASSRYCRGVFKWDLDTAPAEQSVAFLLAAAEKIGGRPLLIATNDETALFVAENAAALKSKFSFPINSPGNVRSLYNKKDMQFLAKRLNIPTAETIFPQSRGDVVAFSNSARYPVMLKASDNIVVSRRAGKKMVIARSKQELLDQYELMEDENHPTLMLQEYIPGKDDSVWMFNGYFDKNSQLRFGLTGRKIHQTPVYTGMTALGICLPNPTVQRQTETLVQAVRYQGILDIGFRYDARDGQFKLLDANPRLGATFRLFVGSDGMDVVRAEYLDLSGQSIPESTMSEGRKWIVEDADLVSSCQYYKDGVLTLDELARGFRGIQEGAWFAADDLMPFGRVLASWSTKPFHKLAKRFAGERAPLAGEVQGGIHVSR